MSGASAMRVVYSPRYVCTLCPLAPIRAEINADGSITVECQSCGWLATIAAEDRAPHDMPDEPAGGPDA